MSTRATVDFGIDLGTTNSAIAVVQDGAPRALRNTEQSEITPSAVLLDRSGGLTIGQHAARQAELRPERVAREFKRAMGTDKVLNLGGQTWTPEQLSAEVLKALIADARTTLAEEVRAAVITVPAMFTLAANEATGRAAALAGIEQAPLLQEPIAAGIAYGVQASDAEGYWVVYDLGGGTFDVSLMTLRQQRLKVIDHDGDEYLGGRNLDEAVIDYAVEELRRQGCVIEGMVRRDDPVRRGLYASLKYQCEQGRVLLSRQERVSIEVTNAADDNGERIDAEVALDRGTLEALIDPFVGRTIAILRRLLDRNSLDPSSVRRVLMVGGPTHTPHIRARVQRALGIELETRIDPMTVVAQGAAVYAGTILRERSDSTAVRIPELTSVQVELNYRPVCEETEELVGGRVGGAAAGLVVQVDRSDGGWSSGRLALLNGIFTTTVALRPRQTNPFVLRAFDSSGLELPVSPDRFAITHGLVVDEPPLSRSLGVAVNDGGEEPKTKVLIEHGARLPATGRHIFRTTYALAPGQPRDIKLHIVEGEYSRADRNDHVGYIRLGGDELRRPLPVGSEIDFKIRVDESRRMSAEAFVSLLDETYTVTIADLRRPTPAVDILRGQVQAEEERLAQIGRVAEVDDAPTRLREARQALGEAEAGDQDAVMRAQRALRSAQGQLDTAAEAASLPLRAAEWRDTAAKTRQVLADYGSTQTRDAFAQLEQEAEGALKAGNQALLRQRLEQAHTLYWRTLMSQDGWWIGYYQYLAERQSEMADPATARLLIQEGRRALDRQDFEALQKACWQLWEQLGGSETTGALPDVGVRA